MPDWDARYAAASGGLFGDQPNEYLRMIAARSAFHPRSALLLADGDGRNGTWVAEQGIDVTAIDISDVGTTKARQRDTAHGVSVERITADLADWTPPPGRIWDAVLAFYLQCEPELRRHAFQTAIGALSPGGWFVVEAFAKAQALRPGMGPNRPEPLYDVAELEDICRGMTIIEAFTGRVFLEEGGAHHGEADVVRFAARRNA